MNCVGGWVRHQHRPKLGDTNNNLSTRHHHSDHNSTKTPNSILSHWIHTHTSQHSTPWLTRLTKQGLVIRGEVWWQPARWWENSAMQPKKHNNNPQSKTLCLHVGMGLRTTRKINPVQILHWIGLNWHTAIHLRMWREWLGPRGILQIRFRIVRKVCNTTTPPFNKQTNRIGNLH